MVWDSGLGLWSGEKSDQFEVTKRRTRMYLNLKSNSSINTSDLCINNQIKIIMYRILNIIAVKQPYH